MTRIARAELRRLRLPLHTPYKLSYRTFHEFEPFLVVLEDDSGGQGIGDAHISPGSSSETREGGWTFLERHLRQIIGMPPDEAKQSILAEIAASKVAATAAVCAIEFLEGHPLLEVTSDTPLPLLTPTSATTRQNIEREVEARLAEGYRCLKIKVGNDVQADLARVGHYQDALAGRGTIRIDANRAYTRDEGITFARSLRPEAIELFEQPCDDADWDANAAVAAASSVPLMLDEPICTRSDIERAGDIANVRYCKLKLKRFGGVARLAESLTHVRNCEMEPVLGDGIGSDLHAWFEACVARAHIQGAGEFNGYLKCIDHVLAEPPKFDQGQMRLRAGVRPSLAPAKLQQLTVDRLSFA